MGINNILWLIISGVLGLSFTGIAIFSCRDKGFLFIAGFNNMSEEEQKSYDEQALCQLMSIFIGTLGICVTMLAMFTVAQMTIAKYMVLAVVIFIIIGGLIYCNVGQRLKK